MLLLRCSRPLAASCVLVSVAAPLLLLRLTLSPPHPPLRAAADVQGAGFSPWCYPDIHPQLGKESQRP